MGKYMFRIKEVCTQLSIHQHTHVHISLFTNLYIYRYKNEQKKNDVYDNIFSAYFFIIGIISHYSARRFNFIALGNPHSNNNVSIISGFSLTFNKVSSSLIITSPI